MSRIRVYIKPFGPDGVYVDSYTEVTTDVDLRSLRTIKRALEGSEYDVGVFKFNSFSIKLRNETGKYSDVLNLQSIFSYKRSDSLVKITWSANNDYTQCGFAICGEARIGEEVTLAEGLLSDEALKQEIFDQKVNFEVLSFQSIFDRVELPVISNGQSAETIIYNILNQDQITDILTISSSNISTDYNATIDDVSVYEGNTVRETLDDMLAISNSVSYIEDNILYVTPRTADTDLSATFYGQSSDLGIENIQDVKNIKSGLNRTFNLLKWKDESISSRNETSIDLYGLRKKEVSYDSITNNTTKEAILDAVVDAFGEPKQELDLTVPLNYSNLLLKMLNRVNADYPAVLIPTGDTLPLYGIAQYGVASYPVKTWDLVLTLDDYYKIMGYTYDLAKELITFNLRRI